MLDKLPKDSIIRMNGWNDGMARSDLVFKALADSTRQRILQVLVRQELCVFELVEVLGQPQSTVSRHLKVLGQADLIVDRRQGTTTTYSSANVSENGDGSDSDVRGRLLEWLRDQPLPRVVGRRLDALVHQRRVRSDAFFEQVGHRWDQMRMDCFGPAFPMEALSVLLPGEWAVADIGVGTGYLLPLLAARFRKVIAVDPVPAMLEIARSRPDLPEAGVIDFRAGDLSNLPIEDGGVDLALAMLVLHHVPSPPDALKELHRVASPGGRVLIVEQAAHQCEEFFDRMQDRWWGFDPEELGRQLGEAGFREIRHEVLASAEPTNAGAPEAPELFVLTARRVAGQTGETADNQTE